MSRKVGGAFFQTRWRSPRTTASVISSGEPGAVKRAWTSRSDMAG
jgi:hypothetical protein